MKIQRKHPFTEELNELDLDITQEQYDAWQEGELIQNAMPNLTTDEREFLISGLLKGEYDSMFNDSPEQNRQDFEDDWDDDEDILGFDPYYSEI